MHDAPLPDDIVLAPRQLTRLLEDRGWTRAGLPARAGLEPGVLENAEASGVASRRVAEALAGAFGVPVALLSGKTPEARDYLARRSTRIAAMVAVIFVLSTWLGYEVGRDLALKHNRADCVAAGRTDCAGGPLSTR